MSKLTSPSQFADTFIARLWFIVVIGSQHTFTTKISFVADITCSSDLYHFVFTVHFFL